MTGFSWFPQIRARMWSGSDPLYIKDVVFVFTVKYGKTVFITTKQNKTLLHDLNLFPLVGIFLESSTLGMSIYISGISIIWWLPFELLSQFRWLNSCNIHPRNPFWVPDSENSLIPGHFHFGDSSHDILLCSLPSCHTFYLSMTQSLFCSATLVPQCPQLGPFILVFLFWVYLPEFSETFPSYRKPSDGL